MANLFDFATLIAPFDIWRPYSARLGGGGAPDLGLPNLATTRLELSTMRLLEGDAAAPDAVFTLIVAPYAVHDATLADFAPGHSLARVLLNEGAGPLALTSWRSASVEMRDFGVDVYLSDLNVAVDDLGGRVSLVGLCQGGWLAALYAARFPRKVASLALAGAPLDLRAAESAITRTLAMTPPAAIAAAIALSGGRVLGSLSLAMWMPGMNPEREAVTALQDEPEAALRAKFETWNAHPFDLPGRYFVETSEWLFRDNRLAENRFPALGRCCGLAGIAAPVYVLAARDDTVVAPPQATAARSRCVGAQVVVREAPGGHLSLFMGRRTLASFWPEIAHWIVRNRSAG
jgi:poly(3-hydroxyalkanoate) synthetase